MFKENLIFKSLISSTVCMLFDRNAIALVHVLHYRKSCSFKNYNYTQIGAQKLIIHMRTLPVTFNNDLRKHC